MSHATFFSVIAPLEMFVYGTLKRGQRNHARYCQGAVSVEPAQVQGRLFHLLAGYPMLAVPREAVLAFGSPDAAADIAKQSSEFPPPSAAEPEWSIVEGELITFADAKERLVALDRLEAYRPADRTGEYWRVLVRLLAPRDRLAWTYVAPHGVAPPGAISIGASWPD